MDWPWKGLTPDLVRRMVPDRAWGLAVTRQAHCYLEEEPVLRRVFEGIARGEKRGDIAQDTPYTNPERLSVALKRRTGYTYTQLRKMSPARLQGVYEQLLAALPVESHDQ